MAMLSQTLAMSMFAFIVTVMCCVSVSADFPSKVYSFDQRIDHFNQMTYGEKTFKQKVLYQDKNWRHDGDPIFFYAGNEGPIEAFWDATGFLHENAPQFNAFVIFPEHRFYGESLPFGAVDSFKPPYLGLLTIDQAMADYAYLLSELKVKLNCTNSKIIAFGGSYGGMLAAYMRFKYPNVIDGSFAASSPILMQAIDGPHNFFFERVTKDFHDADPTNKCVATVRAAFQQMNDLAAKGQVGLDSISSQFKLCDKLTDAPSYKHLQGWVRNAFTMMAMLDYPYPTSFMGSLPGQPVKTACGKLNSASSPIAGLVEAAAVFYNGTSVKCFDIMAEFIECADPTGCGTGAAAAAWDFQACTDLILPDGSNNVTDMFPVLPWTPELRRDYCQKTYNVTPRQAWPGVEFWGPRIMAASNIIFSNGDLDPWMGGGITKDLSPSLVAVEVKGGAHHLDLRASNPLDPQGVKDARQKELDIIRGWLKPSSQKKTSVFSKLFNSLKFSSEKNV